MMNVTKLAKTVVGLGAAAVGLYLIGHWGFERVYVGPGESLMVINKFGDPLPPDRIVVPVGDNRYKGVRQELLGPGRYFLNPITHDSQIVPLVQISAGDPA